MSMLLDMLEQDFDVVLCDAPPLLPVTDAAILARATSGALLIVSAGKTTRHQLTGATEALNTVGAKLAGFVMSMVPTRGPDSYYSAYGYGYGYGYGYREAPAKSDKAGRKAEKRRGRSTPLATVPAAPTLDELGFDSRREAREADRES
nr:hypothetical protein [Microbacterium hominis]